MDSVLFRNVIFSLFRTTIPSSDYGIGSILLEIIIKLKKCLLLLSQPNMLRKLNFLIIFQVSWLCLICKKKQELLTKTGTWFASKETKAISDSTDGSNTNFRPIPTAEDRRTMRRQGSLNRDPRGMRRTGRGRPRNETEEERAIRLEEERQNFLRRPSVSDDEMETTPPESPRYYSDDESYRHMNRKKIVTFQDPSMGKGRGGLGIPNGQVQGGYSGRGGPVGRGISRGVPGQGPRQMSPSLHGPGGPGMKPGYGPNQGPGRGTPQGLATNQMQHRGQVPQGIQQGPQARPGMGPPQVGQYGPRTPNIHQGQRPIMASQQQGPVVRSPAPGAQPSGSPRPGFVPSHHQQQQHRPNFGTGAIPNQQQQHGPNFVQHGPSGAGTIPNQQPHGPNFAQHGPSGTGAIPNQQLHGPNFVQHGPSGNVRKQQQPVPNSAQQGSSGSGVPVNQQRQAPGNYGPTQGQQQVHGPNFVQHSPRTTPGQQQQQVPHRGYGPEGAGQSPLQQHQGQNFAPRGPQGQQGGPQGGRHSVSQQAGQQITPGVIRPGFSPQQGQGPGAVPPGARPGQSGAGVVRGNVPVSRPNVAGQPAGPPGSFVGPQSASTGVSGRQGAPHSNRPVPPGSHSGPSVSQPGVVMSQAKTRPGYGPQQTQRPGGPMTSTQQHGSVPVSQSQPVATPVSQAGIGAPVVKRGGQTNQTVAQVSQSSTHTPPLTNAYLGAPHTPASRLTPVQGQQNSNSSRPGSNARPVSSGRAGVGPNQSDNVRRKGTPPSMPSVDTTPGLREGNRDIKRKGTPPAQGNVVIQSDNRGSQLNSALTSPRATDSSTRQDASHQNANPKKKTFSASHEPQDTQIVMETPPVQLREKKETSYGTGRDQGYRDSFGFEMEDEELPDNKEKIPEVSTPSKVSHYLELVKIRLTLSINTYPSIHILLLRVEYN